VLYFLYNVTSNTEIYSLSLHDALPISNLMTGICRWKKNLDKGIPTDVIYMDIEGAFDTVPHSKLLKKLTDLNVNPFVNNWICERSEEHTSELQSRGHLVCRLLLEKKK